MEVIVCVKQVPGSNRVDVDPETGILKRDGVAAKLNPYDLFALEAAFALAERAGGRVRTLCMGPPQAKQALLETLWMGAEEGVLLSDRKLGGADVAATSYALSLGIQEMGGCDLILCGKQTTDGDTAQVGPELAERLGMEHAANVLKIVEADEKSVTVVMELDGMLQTQRMLLPCLLAIDKDANTPRLPSYRRKKAVPESGLRVLTVAELANAEESRLGLKGSPTRVERIFAPEKKSDKEMWTGTAEETAGRLYGLLKGRKFI